MLQFVKNNCSFPVLISQINPNVMLDIYNIDFIFNVDFNKINGGKARAPINREGASFSKKYNLRALWGKPSWSGSIPSLNTQVS